MLINADWSTLIHIEKYWSVLIFIGRHWYLLVGIGVNATNLIRHWLVLIAIDHWYSMSWLNKLPVPAFWRWFSLVYSYTLIIKCYNEADPLDPLSFRYFLYPLEAALPGDFDFWYLKMERPFPAPWSKTTPTESDYYIAKSFFLLQWNLFDGKSPYWLNVLFLRV